MKLSGGNSMQKGLIIFSILVIMVLACVDTITRIVELSNLSSLTPRQIEIKKDIQKSTGNGLQEKKDNISNQFAYPKSHQPSQTRQNMPQKFNNRFKERNRLQSLQPYNP